MASISVGDGLVGGDIDDLRDGRRGGFRVRLRGAACERDSGDGQQQRQQDPESRLNHRNVSFQLRMFRKHGDRRRQHSAGTAFSR